MFSTVINVIMLRCIEASRLWSFLRLARPILNFHHFFWQYSFFPEWLLGFSPGEFWKFKQQTSKWLSIGYAFMKNSPVSQYFIYKYVLCVLSHLPSICTLIRPKRFLMTLKGGCLALWTAKGAYAIHKIIRNKVFTSRWWCSACYPSLAHPRQLCSSKLYAQIHSHLLWWTMWHIPPWKCISIYSSNSLYLVEAPFRPGMMLNCLQCNSWSTSPSPKVYSVHCLLLRPRLPCPQRYVAFVFERDSNKLVACIDKYASCSLPFLVYWQRGWLDECLQLVNANTQWRMASPPTEFSHSHFSKKPLPIPPGQLKLPNMSFLKEDHLIDRKKSTIGKQHWMCMIKLFSK